MGFLFLWVCCWSSENELTRSFCRLNWSSYVRLKMNSSWSTVLIDSRLYFERGLSVKLHLPLVVSAIFHILMLWKVISGSLCFLFTDLMWISFLCYVDGRQIFCWQALRARELDQMFPIIDPKAKPTTKPKIFISLLWKQLNHLG